MKNIIGISGFAGSGKSTVASYLVENYNFKQLSFADTLKDAVSDIFGWDREFLEGVTKESREWREQKDEFWSNKFGKTITPRYILQTVGTESFRNIIHPDIWIFSLEKKILDKNYDNVVISDCRFVNELSFISTMKNGQTWRIIKGSAPEWYNTAIEDAIHGTNKMKEMYPNIHSSEYSSIFFSFSNTIQNNGSLEELYIKINEIMEN